MSAPGATSDIIFLGSGASTGVPHPLCLLQPTDPPCSVCQKAMEGPPEHNKNYRCTPSVMIKYIPDLDSEPQYIQIDCGKCFREQVLRWYTGHKIPRMDALILTHEHADAVLGLDDISGLQPDVCLPSCQVEPTPVYMSPHTMESVLKKFGYLASKSKRLSPDAQVLIASNSNAKGAQVPTSVTSTKEGSCIPNESQMVSQRTSNHNPICTKRERDKGSKQSWSRRVASLDWKLIQPSVAHPFDVKGLRVTPLPVLHGEDYISLGFEFGAIDRVVYISDVSRIPVETMSYLEERKQRHGRPRVVIIDSAQMTQPHKTHFWFPEALSAICALQPISAYMIGMTHDFDHEAVNKELARWSLREGIHVELSWDGLAIPVRL